MYNISLAHKATHEFPKRYPSILEIAISNIQSLKELEEAITTIECYAEKVFIDQPLLNQEPLLH